MASSTTARDSWYVLLAQIFNMGGLKWLYLYTFIQTCSCFWHSFGRYHLKMDGWKTIFLLGWLPCRCNVSVREETIYKKNGFLLAQNFRQPIWNVNVPQVSTGFILKICFFFFFREGKIYFIHENGPWRTPWPSPKSCLRSTLDAGDSLGVYRNLRLTDVSHLYQVQYIVNKKHIYILVYIYVIEYVYICLLCFWW